MPCDVMFSVVDSGHCINLSRQADTNMAKAFFHITSPFGSICDTGHSFYLCPVVTAPYCDIFSDLHMFSATCYLWGYWNGEAINMHLRLTGLKSACDHITQKRNCKSPQDTDCDLTARNKQMAMNAPWPHRSSAHMQMPVHMQKAINILLTWPSLLSLKISCAVSRDQ